MVLVFIFFPSETARYFSPGLFLIEGPFPLGFLVCPFSPLTHPCLFLFSLFRDRNGRVRIRWFCTVVGNGCLTQKPGCFFPILSLLFLHPSLPTSPQFSLAILRGALLGGAFMRFIYSHFRGSPFIRTGLGFPLRLWLTPQGSLCSDVLLLSAYCLPARRMTVFRFEASVPLFPSP